jgi:hypothetical protein
MVSQYSGVSIQESVFRSQYSGVSIQESDVSFQFTDYCLLITEKSFSPHPTPHTPHPTPPPAPRVDSFKLSTADFESINLNENSQVYLFLIKRVSDNN